MPDIERWRATWRGLGVVRSLLALFIVVAVAACSGGDSEGVPLTNTNVAKVAAYQDGRITLDGRDASMEQVRTAFVELSRNKGVVWYYRQAADAEPHPNAMQVIEAIVAAQLPVSMSTTPDFSDVVRPDGTTKPR